MTSKKTRNAIRTIAGLLTIVLLITKVANGQPATDRPTFTVEDRKKIKAIIGEFRRSANEPANRDAAAEKLFAYGEPGIKAFQPIIAKELSAKMRAYSALFQKVAVTENQSRIRQLDLNHVQSLQQAVLNLKEDDGLTKDRIVREGDPALSELQELLVIPTADVLANPKVQALRETLLQTGKYWERLQQFRRAGAVAAGDLPTAAAISEVLFAENLAAEEDLIAQLAMPMKPENRAVIVANKTAAKQISPEEAKCIMACNLMRNLLGLNVLKIDVKMCLAARDHSADMAKKGFFAHESPVAGKRNPSDRAKNFGTTANAENIYKGGNSGIRANKGWFHSPGHHKNMLSKHQRIGVGYHEQHFTEMFGN